MTRLRKFICLALLGLGVLAAGAWAASYFWQPQVGFPWPTSGLKQTHDRGFVLLINGRIFIARQRVILAPRGSDVRIPGPSIIMGNSTREAGSLFMLDRFDSVRPSDSKFYFIAPTLADWAA